jgi:hypothetical protein
MMNSRLALWVRSVAIATILTSIMLAALIVGAEEIPALKNWLKLTFYHHWLGKSVLALGLFTIVSLALRFKRDTPRLSRVIMVEAIVVILSACIIAGFFLLHTLKIV